MPGVDDYFPPIAYAWWWWTILPAFVALLVAWILLSKVLARRIGRPPSAVELPVPWVPPRDAQKDALAAIDGVLARASRGELDARGAHVELSAIVREYGYQRTGVDARAMTLEELRRSRLDRLAEVVSGFYPIAFAPDPHAAIAPAADRAREVVTTWS